jgi:hypothetical protein
MALWGFKKTPCDFAIFSFLSSLFSIYWKQLGSSNHRQSWEDLDAPQESASLESKYWLNTLEPQERPTWWLHSD